jgi:hypothetical protein
VKLVLESSAPLMLAQGALNLLGKSAARVNVKEA